MTYAERASSFDCQGQRLQAIFCVPGQAARRGILIVVGGAQYRVGSHRQFVLMARYFAGCGMAVMRFDYRGMGDSAGAPRDYDALHDDLHAAINHFVAERPEVGELVLLGLCDGASAIALYGASDPRVSALVLLNPWVHNEARAASAMLRHYYARRVLSPQFWRKLARAELQPGAALRALFDTVKANWMQARKQRSAAAPGRDGTTGRTVPGPCVAERVRTGLQQFTGPVLIVLGAEDATGREFAAVAAGRDWRPLRARPGWRSDVVAGADHTFSRRQWREQACALVQSWSASW